MKNNFNFGNFRIPDFSPKPIKIKPIKIKQIRIKNFGRGKPIDIAGKEFEDRVKRDLKKKGYKVSKSHHRHYDIHATRGSKEIYVECKCTTARLSPAEEDFAFSCLKKGKHYWIVRKTKTGRIEYKKY